jgi:hypothetical protein
MFDKIIMLMLYTWEQGILEISASYLRHYVILFLFFHLLLLISKI